MTRTTFVETKQCDAKKIRYAAIIRSDEFTVADVKIDGEYSWAGKIEAITVTEIDDFILFLKKLRAKMIDVYTESL
jgi:hypothetical protein